MVIHGLAERGVFLNAKQMINWTILKRQWLVNPKEDIPAGAVVGLALIPEAIAFSIIAGVDPQVGLYASFIIAVLTAFSGGRPGSISAATGAMALLMVDLVKDHGLQYLLAATILTGIFQIGFGVFKTAKQMRGAKRPILQRAIWELMRKSQIPVLVFR